MVVRSHQVSLLLVALITVSRGQAIVPTLPLVLDNNNVVNAIDVAQVLTRLDYFLRCLSMA